MNRDDWVERCAGLLEQQAERHLLRRRKIVHPIDATHLQIDGRRFVNFSSNNYLGLTHHPRLLEAQRSSSQSGSGAAGLISGYTDLHAQAETALAKWKGTEAAVLLPSGYQANVAAVQTIAAIGESYRNGVRFLVDKLSHASLIDAVRATKSSVRVFPHNGMNKLGRLLEAAEEDQLQVVLTESIFSMDGDAADLREIAKLKQSHSFLLLLDEAHASGVYGKNGAGFAAELGLQSAVDVSIVTLSKALGSCGGAVGCSTVFRDALVNFGRAYIYSTSVPPAIAACAMAALEVIKDEPQRQKRVRELARRVRSELRTHALPCVGFPADSPIVAIVLGSEKAALEASEKLQEQGLLVLAVRPPTVAKGSSRLRVTLSSEHTDEEIDKLIRTVQEIRQ